MADKEVKVSVPLAASLHKKAVKLAKSDQRSLGRFIATLVEAAVSGAEAKR